jgi:hypothetical protein
MIGNPMNKIIAKPAGKKNQKKLLFGMRLLKWGKFNPHLKI